MNIYLKRSLIGFSLALNIGFLAAAGIIYWKHPPTHQYKYSVTARELIHGFSLPAEQNQKITACLDEFIDKMSVTGMGLYQRQNDMLTLLSAPGGLDRDKFESLCTEQKDLFSKKMETLRDHFLKMRKLLGEEKSREFFSALQDQKG